MGFLHLQWNIENQRQKTELCWPVVCSYMGTPNTFTILSDRLMFWYCSIHRISNSYVKKYERCVGSYTNSWLGEFTVTAIVSSWRSLMLIVRYPVIFHVPTFSCNCCGISNKDYKALTPRNGMPFVMTDCHHIVVKSQFKRVKIDMQLSVSSICQKCACSYIGTVQSIKTNISALGMTPFS